MGEWQKSLGEKGEAITAAFMDLIGWSPSGPLDITCKNKKHLGEKKNPRTEHGIDGLFSYRSPLYDGYCDVVAISIKYSEKPYPAKQSDFKGYYDQLAEFIQCYQKSDEFKKQRDYFPDCERFRNLGVVFMFTADNPYAEHRSVALKVDVVPNDVTHNYQGIYLVDNKAASFVFDTATRVKSWHPTAKVSYAYFDTGKCKDPRSREYSGNVLPLEYLGLGLLPLKVVEEGVGNTLYLSCAADYSEEEVARLIGLAQSMSQDWPSKIKIAFPSFDKIKDGASAARVLNGFNRGETAAKVEFVSVKQSFLHNEQTA